jgi:DNA polymerase-3 subunit alpha
MTGQVNLFDDLFSGPAADNAVSATPEPPLADVAPWPYNHVLQKEKEFLSFYVSGHPLDRFQDEIRGFATLSLKPESLAGVKDGSAVTVGGLIISLRPHVQRDGKPMAFLEIEDFDGSIELLVFGDAYEKFRAFLTEDAMVLVHGTISKREGEEKPKIRMDNCIALADAREKLARSVHLRLNTNGLEKEYLQKIHDQCAREAGECALIFHVVTAEGNEFRILARKVKASPSPDSIKAIREIVGKENVWLGKSAA